MLKVYEYFEQNYGYVDIKSIPRAAILEYLERGYVINLSFERKMDCLYDYILSQDLCNVQE
jgi:hypothetical protein